ncbi:MAG: flavodoxin family protein [Spirochaetes bacterium]|nr:flavodoxin family protein [Spirochaetota bacterium]MBU0956304.1 flavodoxin family protein [Spirochaetota bacterium]
MKILSVMGSPHKNGNTAALLSAYLKGVIEANPEAEINELYLDEMNIRPCRGCFTCQTGGIENCAVKDDMSGVYGNIVDTDVIIYATPIYTFSMSAQMKAFADRTFAVAWQLRNKKIVSLAVYGNPSAEVSGVLGYQEYMKKLCQFAGMKYLHGYNASSGLTPVEKNPKVLDDVYKLGSSLTT